MSTAVVALTEAAEVLEEVGWYGPGTGSPPVTVSANALLPIGVRARKAKSNVVFFAADFVEERLNTVCLLEAPLALAGDYERLAGKNTKAGLWVRFHNFRQRSDAEVLLMQKLHKSRQC